MQAPAIRTHWTVRNRRMVRTRHSNAVHRHLCTDTCRDTATRCTDTCPARMQRLVAMGGTPRWTSARQFEFDMCRASSGCSERCFQLSDALLDLSARARSASLMLRSGEEAASSSRVGARFSSSCCCCRSSLSLLLRSSGRSSTPRSSWLSCQETRPSWKLKLFVSGGPQLRPAATCLAAVGQLLMHLALLLPALFIVLRQSASRISSR
eukprot:3744705-Rhodomonas_salina.3